MQEYIDITFPVSAKFPAWPGSIGFSYQWHMKMEDGETNNLSSFTIDSHLGTHLDAPLHFVHKARQLEQLELSKLIGKAYLAEIRNKRSITADDLEKINVPADCKKLLLKTDNQVYWENNETTFQEDFCSIDKSGAQWLVDKQFDLIGIDYLSIQRFYDGPETHQILLQAEIVIVETLNLQNVSQGVYELICLPLKLEGLEASPVRAVLRKL
jgi:arylformamidase